MPIGTPFHERTFPLCESLNYREWSGYYTVSAYETHHEHEYNAIRNAAALIDISPLFKYRVTGRDATRLVDRIITRDMRKVTVGQVIYTPWCDEQGKVIDDGTVSRLDENVYRWTAADPSLRWFTQNAMGLDVNIEDISESVAALALQGPTSGRLLKALAENADLENLKYFRVTKGMVAGVPVEISRTGYTGDLGYEIWVQAAQALRVWDALVAAQKYSPFEMGLGRLVHLEKNRFIGQQALVEEKKRGPAKSIVGLEIDWTEVERYYEAVGLPPAVSPIASRVAVPVYSNSQHIGKATSTTWSPVLKKMIALATVTSNFAKPGTRIEIEITVEAVRHRVGAKVVKTPFYSPKQKTATPVT